MNILEPSIVRNIQQLVPVETVARVLFSNHPMLDDEEFHIMIPKKMATIRDLQEEMGKMGRLKENGWDLEEFHFFARDLTLGMEAELDPDDIIEEYGVLRLRLISGIGSHEWGSDNSTGSDSENELL